MKALTLHQPWASAIAFGLKQFETRPRNTNYRGPLAIHAGKTMDRNSFGDLTHIPWLDHISLPLARRWGPVLHTDFPTATIVAIADLTDSIRMTEDMIASISDMEHSLGGWQADGEEEGEVIKARYAYKLENVRMLKTPIAAKGQQGMWNVSEDAITAINEQFDAK